MVRVSFRLELCKVWAERRRRFVADFGRFSRFGNPRRLVVHPGFLLGVLIPIGPKRVMGNWGT